MNKSYYQKVIIAKKMIYPIIQETSETVRAGIYLFERTDENGITFFYCGQARNIYNRIISHWNGYQRIDISMRNRKFKSKENPYGWSFKILEYCDESILDDREQYYILECLKQGKQTYNLTYGSQSQGKQTITEGKSTKGYREGLEQGRKNLAKELKHIIDTHLTITLNIQKQGNKVSQKALDKFWRLLEETENNNE